jgi:prepilin-type N-terminal cleavage/methylation domain-containing protein
MKSWRMRSREKGFTVIEVIVAVVLIGLVATSAVTFFVSGVSTVSDLQRKQTAVSLANSAIDKARSVSPSAVTTTGISGLVRGRDESSVVSSWDAATAAHPEDTSDMEMDWDSEASGQVADQWVPISDTARVDSQDYAITTLIGKCYRPKGATTTSAECIKTIADSDSASYVKMFRVRVVVTWSESASAEPQTYRMATLIDPSVDAVWNTVLKPYAYDDEVTVEAGSSPQFIAVIANDQLEYNTDDAQAPIRNLTQPSHGSVASGSGLQNNGVVYTPPADSSLAGTVTFQYAVRSVNGEVSSPATVTVHIIPKPTPDSMTVAFGSKTVLNEKLLKNDLGTKNIAPDRTVRIVPVSDPKIDLISIEDVSDETLEARERSERELADRGISVNASGEVSYQAPARTAATSSVDFYYFLVDEVKDNNAVGTRNWSREAVKVTITSGACVYVNDIEVDITADKKDQFIDLGINAANGNDSDCLIEIVSVNYSPHSKKGQIQVGSNDYNETDNKRANKISYKFQDDVPFQFQITYKMYGPDGLSTTGETGVITVTVIPVATDDEYSLKKNSSLRFANTPQGSLRKNDWPSGGGQLNIKIESDLTCGSFTQGLTTNAKGKFLNNDGIEFKAPNKTGTCTFTYRLVGLDKLDHIQSEVATVKIKVEN